MYAKTRLLTTCTGITLLRRVNRRNTNPGELAACPRKLVSKVDAEVRVLAGDFLKRGSTKCVPAAMATDIHF